MIRRRSITGFYYGHGVWDQLRDANATGLTKGEAAWAIDNKTREHDAADERQEGARP